MTFGVIVFASVIVVSLMSLKLGQMNPFPLEQLKLLIFKLIKVFLFSPSLV